MKRIIFLMLIVFALVRPGFAQEQAATDVSILDSRFLTTEPTVGEAFKYFLKFDYQEGVNVHPVEHFTENGMTVIEQKRLEPHKFQGRVIEQYEYTLSSQQEGERRFIPVSIHCVGPLENPVVVQAEPAQITVLPTVDVQVVTNSPIMLNESLELNLSVTKRKPVTITSMPSTIGAPFLVPTPDSAGQGEPDSQTSTLPSPPPPPPPLRFELDQSQKITPQQMNAHAVEQYKYNILVSPEKAGEYVVPAIAVTYRSATGEEIQARTNETSIFVLNPNTGNLAIQTDYRFLIFPGIVAAAMILAGIGVFFYLKYRKPRIRKEAIVEPALPPGEIAHNELAQIRALKLPAKGEFKTYYSMVSESVRKFVGAEFDFHVLERTTEEVMYDIRKRDVPDSVREHTGKFLREADMVKFAKYIPLPIEADTAMEQALTIVDESVEYHRAKAAAEAMVRNVKGSDSPKFCGKRLCL